MESDFLNCGAKVSLFSVTAKCFAYFFILDGSFPLFDGNNAMKKSLPLLEEQTLCWNNILLTNLLDDAKLDENFLQSLHSIFYLLLCVVGH